MMSRSILILIAFIVFGCQNQDAVSETNNTAISDSLQTETVEIAIKSTSVFDTVQVLKYDNRGAHIIVSQYQVKDASIDVAVEGLSLLYLKVSGRDKLIPIVTDQDIIEISFEGEKKETNSTETETMWRLDEFYRANQKLIKSDPTSLLKQVQLESPSFSAFNIMATIQKVGKTDFELIDSIVSEFYMEKDYSNSWVSYVFPHLNPDYLKIGSEAPDFTLMSVNGEKMSLSDFKGKFVLLDFWATWCGPCMREMPNVKREYDTFKSKGFEVLGVSLDRTEEPWKKVISSRGFNWNHVYDTKDFTSAANLYNVTAIPSTFLIDRDGKIIAKNLRGAMLKKELDRVLKD